MIEPTWLLLATPVATLALLLVLLGRSSRVHHETLYWLWVSLEQDDWREHESPFDSVSYERMVLSFWRSPRSFAPGWLRDAIKKAGPPL